tara:strand:+ start:23492 stop:24868 length:1377 start_codon:yes stop_codon:yes gene_type:complete
MIRHYRIFDFIIKYGTLVFVFLIPWQARLILVEGSINGDYWEYGTQSLYATEVLLFLILIALIAKGTHALKHKKPQISVKKLYTPLGAFAILVVWSGLSIIWSSDSSVSLEHWIVLVEAGVIFLVLGSRAVSFNSLAWTIIASGFIQAVIGISQSFLQVVPSSTILGTALQDARDLGVSVVETVEIRWLRAYGTFPHPNILGAWLVLSLMLLLNESRSLVVALGGESDQTTRMRFAIRYLVFGVIIFGLLATFSRSAWLAALTGVGIFIAMAIKKKMFRRLAIKMTAILILVVVLFGYMFPEQLSTRVSMQNRLEVRSTQERGASLAQGWEVIKKNRILGTGIGSYGLSVHRNIDDSKPAYFYQPVHNMFLLIWAELGIIGLIFVIVFALFIVNFVYLGTKKKQEISISLMFLIPFAVLGLFDHYMWSLYSGLMIGISYLAVFWLILSKNNIDSEKGS